MKKFAIILSGCGVYDGSEIHEAVFSMLAVERAGASYTIFAPNIKQHHVIDHITGAKMNEERNVLVESARISRGKIQDLNEYNAQNFDALLMPGGFGAAKNLSNYAFEGEEMKVIPEVEKAIKDTFTAHKPIGAVCIAPVILAKVLGDKEIILTIGQDSDTAKTIFGFGAQHKATNTGDILSDKENLIFTAPCYMLNAGIADIANETQLLIDEMLRHM